MPATAQTSGTPALERLQTITEVADLLGVQVRHVRRLVHEQRIPYIKWGHLLRFDPEQVRVWIDQHRHEPVTHPRSGRSAHLSPQPAQR